MRHLGDHRHHQSCGCNAAAAAGGRRGFLQSFAALGAGAALPACSTPNAADAGTTWIDTHHHFYPPEIQKAGLEWEDKRGIPHFTQQVGWSVQGALADMDAAGVRTANLSIASTPGIWFEWAAPEVARIVRSCNDDAVVYFHPLVASCCGRLSVGTFPAVLEAPHDTTRAGTNVLLLGTFARCRDIQWLFSHGGGAIPMLAGRIDIFHGIAKNVDQFAPNGIEAEFQRLFYDTANATHPASMAAPRALGLPDASLRGIERGNAMRLLPKQQRA